MPILLYIPWFKPGPLDTHIPAPWGGHIEIHLFGVLVAAGVLLGARLAERWAEKHDISPRVVADLIGHSIIAGFIGAYLLNGAFYNQEAVAAILDDPANLFRRYLGLSSYGGFIGASIGALIWRFRRRLSILAIGDGIAFAFPLGWLFGRTGCFVTHDHPGRITDFFLAVSDYEFGYPPFEPRHDLGLYEVIWSAAVMALFLVLNRQRRPAGFYLAMLPLLYAPVRFGLDFLRADPTEGGDVRYLGLTPGHYASVLLFAVALALLVRVYRGTPITVPARARLAAADGADGQHGGAERRQIEDDDAENAGPDGADPSAASADAD